MIYFAQKASLLPAARRQEQNVVNASIDDEIRLSFLLLSWKSLFLIKAGSFLDLKAFLKKMGKSWTWLKTKLRSIDDMLL